MKQNNIRRVFICKYCGKECKNLLSLRCHETKCKNNPDRKTYINGMKGKTAWNKGLTKDDPRVKKHIYTYNKNREKGIKIKYDYSKHNTKEINEKRRLTALKNIKEGKVKPISHSRSKHGWYNGIWCDSSWELAYVIYCKDNNILIERNKKGFEYQYKGKTHLYFPDFYNITQKCYIEVKGYKDERSELKKKSFKSNLKEYGRKEIKPILKYVEEKYGKDFVKLYNN